MPSGRHPNPTKRPLLELEVRICGRRDSWVRVPASCQSPWRWANISGMKRGAACPARPSGARRCWALRWPGPCQGLGAARREEVPGPRKAGRWLEEPEADSRLLSGPWRPLRRINSEVLE